MRNKLSGYFFAFAFAVLLCNNLATDLRESERNIPRNIQRLATSRVDFRSKIYCTPMDCSFLVWVQREKTESGSQVARAQHESWELKAITLTYPFDNVVREALSTSVFRRENFVDTGSSVLPVAWAVIRRWWLWQCWHWHWDRRWRSQIPSKVRWSGIGVACEKKKKRMWCQTYVRNFAQNSRFLPPTALALFTFHPGLLMFWSLAAWFWLKAHMIWLCLLSFLML